MAEQGTRSAPFAWLKEGRPWSPPVSGALKDLLGLESSQDGFCRLFRPSFPGLRSYVIQPRVAPDRAVELTLVGVARSGRPVLTGTRAFVLGRDGSLEIHRGFDEVEPAYQHRNFTVDLIRNELALLALARTGPASRLTIDAEGVGRYVCALHGFVFADETDDGPPVRSARAFDPEGDRARLIAAAEAFVEATARRLGLGRLAVEAASRELASAKTAWDLARLHFPGEETPLAGGSDGASGVTRLGRDFLLHRETPGWRGALYLTPRNRALAAAATAYRAAKTTDGRSRYDEEVGRALRSLSGGPRASRLRALETLGLLGGSELGPRLREVAEGPDRRVAAVARRVLLSVAGQGLAERMRSFALDEEQPPERRAWVLRVLAEHHPSELSGKSQMLRVHPDPRIQRAAIPLIAAAPQSAAELAAMLAANPRGDERPGLDELRLELIEAVAERADPMTLPVLLEQFADPNALPSERLALSRALVRFSDPRSRQALAEASRSSVRPPLP